MILFIGCITSYEDFKTSKIRNKWILAGLLYSLAIYILSWILYVLSVKGIINYPVGEAVFYIMWYFDKWCINLVISTVVSYLLWHFKVWAAGDAKLFICYSALIPMGQYSKVYFNYYFASFFLLLTIFIPATVYLFLRSSIYFIKRFKFGEVKEKMSRLIRERFAKFNFFEVSKMLLGFFAFFLLLRVLRLEVQNLLSMVLPGQNVVTLVALLLFRPLSRIFKKNTRLTITTFIVLIAYLGFKMAFGKQFLSQITNTLTRAMVIVVLFPVTKKVIGFYAERAAQETTPFAHWMFLGALIAWFI